MKTDQLIESLSASVAPASPRRLTVRMAAAMVGGGLAGLALTAGWLGLETLPALTAKPFFWLRLALLAGLVGALLPVAETLARSAARPTLWPLAAMVGLMVALAAVQLAAADRTSWSTLVMGSSWKACPYRVAAIALCAFPFFALAMRSGAPTSPSRAGGAAGALAGALGAVLYALVCREPGLAFVVLWYGAGIALATTAGALIGPWILGWSDHPGPRA